MKRKADSTPSSMFTKLDWLDSTVADATASKMPAHESAVEKKVKVEPCLHDFFINMLQSRGYPGSTHATLDCGYSNQPTVRSSSSTKSRSEFDAHFSLCVHTLLHITATSSVKLRPSFH